jgi:hypothetical protein
MNTVDIWTKVDVAAVGDSEAIAMVTGIGVAMTIHIEVAEEWNEIKEWGAEEEEEEEAWVVLEQWVILLVP